MSSDALSKVEESLDLTDAEEELVRVASTQTMPNVINHTRILSQLHLSRRMEAAADQVEGATMGLQVAIKKSTEKLIESNENLAAANRKYALGLNILTGVLAAVTLVQVLLPIFR